MSWVWTQAWRRQRQLWQRGELRVLTLSLMLSVAAASAVGLFSERLWRALVAQGGDALGADFIVSSRQPLPETLVTRLVSASDRHTRTLVLNSAVWAGDSSVLTGIKAVREGYPLRGQLRIADQPYAPEAATDTVPAPGTAWADARLWAALDLQPGQTIEIGNGQLIITQLLAHEPDRGAGFADLAPRLLMHADDLDRMGLSGAGSRATHALLLNAEGSQRDALFNIPIPDGISARSTDSARPEIRTALDRASQFLNLAAMAALLLATAAISLSAWQYGRRLQPEAALLRCLGAARRQLVFSLSLSLLLLTLVATVAGLLLGWLSQQLLAGIGAELLGTQLPPAHAWPALKTGLLALLLMTGLVLPALWQATGTPPLRVLQQAVPAREHRQRLLLAAGLTLVLALVLQSGSWRLSLLTLLGAGSAIVILALLMFLLLALLTPLRQRSGGVWHRALANLARRRSLTIAQGSAFGLGLLVLLLLSVVRQDLISAWQDRLPADTPNQFLIDIQPDQVPDLQAFLAERGLSTARLWPMARGRLVAVNEVPADDARFDDPETRRWINRDFNLSWTDTLGEDNTLLEGPWWSATELDQPWLSADDYARERLDLQLGDRLTLNFAGREVTLTVRNFRRVDWSSFQPNFFLLTTPGALPDTPATWLTSFYLPPEERPRLRELNQRFPNVTALDLTSLMAQVRDIIERIVSAMEFVFLFTLAAGLAVLWAAMEASRDQRRREIALMRALGATASLIRRGLLLEFALLGLLAGLVAAVAAQVIGMAIAQQVFALPYAINPRLFLFGGLGGAALVSLLGWLVLRATVFTPPRQVLDQEALS